MSQSGQQIAKDNVAKFAGWVAEREAASDWRDYLRNGKLNRSEIADECGFALSVLRQNPAIKQALQALEDDLMARGIIIRSQASPDASNDAAEASRSATDNRILVTKAKAEARVKALEEQNAALKAEVADLREKLRRLDHLDAHLGRTGRLLPT
ncbi:MAG: VPA1267 family protein [Burkholderiales bacterium]